MIGKTFYPWLIATAAVLLTGIYGLSLVMTMPIVLYIAVVFFGLLTVVLYRNILQANEKSPRRFVTAFMGSVTIKLLVTLAFLAIYLYFDRVNKVQVALGFFVIYIGEEFDNSFKWGIGSEIGFSAKLFIVVFYRLRDQYQ
jgi:hypothetical protein